MIQRTRLAAVLALGLLAACGSSTTSEAAVFGEPSSVAVFRGVTLKSGRDDGNPVYPYRPYLAVANAASNSVSVIDAIDDSFVQSPAVSRGLVYSVPGRPVLLAAADLGDRLPDLLVVATAGELPWLGGTQLSVLRTWRADGAIVDRTDGGPAVEFGADIVALAALPFDPTTAPTSVKLVAALAGERIATVTFTRRAGSDAIDVDAAQATVRVSAPLGFQPVDLAAIPGERNRVFAATNEAIGSVRGVAEIDVTGTPVLSGALNARAPTRLVAAGRLVEGDFGVPALDATPFAGRSAVSRVWAVLDESGCGLRGPIGCGVVALDPDTRDLVPDPTPAGTMHAPYRAPIPIAYPVAIGASPPPARPPADDGFQPQVAVTAMRIEQTQISRITTGVAGVVSSTGAMTYVDLGRWDVPTNQAVIPNVKGTVTSARPTGSTGTQWLTLVDPANGTTIGQTDGVKLSASLTVTPGYTPNELHWAITAEGALPGLSLRRAQPFADGGLALQVTDGGGVHEVVRLWDPTLGVTAGDIVVIEPTDLGTCTTFEAAIASLNPPSPERPGGSVTLGYRTPANATWNACVDAMKTAAGATYLATIRAGGFVLVRGVGAAAVHVGRPRIGERFEVRWEDEAPLVSGCPLPPAAPWQSAWASSPPTCDGACRDTCQRLVRARLARRIGYVWEAEASGVSGPAITGPALGFTLGITAPTARTVVEPRELLLTISTVDGRSAYVVTPTAGSYVEAHQALFFDRSPWSPAAGTRFFVPYRSGVVMDSTPSLSTNQVTTIR